MSKTTATAKIVPMQDVSLSIWDMKYNLKDKNGVSVDRNIAGTRRRNARALAKTEKKNLQSYWEDKFFWAMENGAIPAGRIVSNSGAMEYKPATSLINCTVSRTIQDSMFDIMMANVDAAMTLKAGCVAPGTLIYTEKGMVAAERAVFEKHSMILSYDINHKKFEMKRIEQHLTTHVPHNENIEIVSNGVSLKTSIKHPVLVFRNNSLSYVRADEITLNDAMIHHEFAWEADKELVNNAWFAGAHLGDGSAYEKKTIYNSLRKKWAEKANEFGTRLIFKIRAAERQVVERYAEFFNVFCSCTAKVVPAFTLNNTPVWDFTVSSFAASQAASLFDNQIGKKTNTMRVPEWISKNPEKSFLPFLAGLIDTDGTISKEYGSATISMASNSFAEELKSILGLFGIHGGITVRKHRSHIYNGNNIIDNCGSMLKISDSAFLAKVAEFMADSGKKERIFKYASASGQCNKFAMTESLKNELNNLSKEISYKERNNLGFYHKKHESSIVTRVYLDKWENRFPQLKELIGFVKTLRPVEGINRNIEVSETFYDFTVEKNNNYLAGNNGLAVIHNCGIGYNFSTLRPNHSFVHGAGAGTSGPLSFMNVFDSTCFTVMSAGGRRGAQMATMDVGHPDIMDFIKAKRTAGVLRQFNMSVLITDEFIAALKAKQDWKLAFPATKAEIEEGCELVYRKWPTDDEGKYTFDTQGRAAMKVYKTLPAINMWNVIMASTYDYAEPGFLLIDRVNEFNNNWFDEYIVATNPCVSGDTWVHTTEGPRQVSNLVGVPHTVIVDGKPHKTGKEGFFKTGVKPTLNIKTEEGFAYPPITSDHLILKAYIKDGVKSTEWIEAGSLKKGDQVVLNNHREFAEWKGAGTSAQGYALGINDMFITLETERSSSDFCRGFLRGFFDINGYIIEDEMNDYFAIALSRVNASSLAAVQRMLARLGVISSTTAAGDLFIYKASMTHFAEHVGFADIKKHITLNELLSKNNFSLYYEDFIATISSVSKGKKETVYDVQVPGINAFDANGLYVHNCGEQPLPPGGSCLLGSINLVMFVKDPFTEQASFDWKKYDEVIRIFTRMLDNVVELNGLPLQVQRDEIIRKRRHGMGYLGLGSALSMMCIPYGSQASLEFTDKVTRELAVVGWKEALELAKEKGPAPIMKEKFTVTGAMLAQRPEMAADGYKIGDKVLGRILHAKYSRYMQRIASVEPELVLELEKIGARFTHHSSIAPTGTISLSLGNNVSNGIEPTFSHSYSRNIIKIGKNSKELVDVSSYELLAYRTHVNPDATDKDLPAYFSTSEVSPKSHIDVQAAAQKWIDSSISKTINVPTEIKFEDFQDVYSYAIDNGLKGCTTYRFNPDNSSGVLVKKDDLANTIYKFKLEDGTEITARGDESIWYDGQEHTAANLCDALKEGYYGKF
jgi:ribonucleotide reductase alpha subunit